MAEKQCRYYGKSRYGLSSYGNQCPLRSGFSPCEMEVFKKMEPNWSRCMLNPEVIMGGAAIHEPVNESEAKDG